MKKSFFLLAFIAFFGLISQYVWADSSLSVLPREGGNSLRFGRVQSGQVVNKEATIRITSTGTTKYQIEQRLLDPLIDEKGGRLNPQALQFYTVRGSNARGSLYQDTLRPLGSLKRVLYVSAANGASDSFSVFYTLDGRQINTSGNFFTRILYTLTPQEAGGTAKEVILNVYFNTQREFDVNASTSSGTSRRLELTEDKDGYKGYIKLTTKGSLGEKYEITQTLQEPLKNEKGQIIPLDVCKFFITASKGEPFYSSFYPLERRPLSVYSSGSSGKEDDIAVNFSIDKKDLESIDSGRYQGLLIYSVDSGGTLIKRVPLNLEFEIKPAFDIEVISESVGGLHFRGIKPKSGPVQKEVIIKVNTNLGKPYSVVQKLNTPLTNTAGDTIPLEYFTFKQQLGNEQAGRIAYSSNTPLSIGDTTVFTSDAKGSPVEFAVIYSLQVPRDVKGGDYYTGLSFSLVEK
jgi:hypothetical protein